MNVQHMSSSEFKRNLNGIIKRMKAGRIDKVVIHQNGANIAEFTSPALANNPLELSLHLFRERYHTANSERDTVDAFNEFLNKEIEDNPHRLKYIDHQWLEEMNQLTEGVEIEIDKPLDDN